MGSGTGCSPSATTFAPSRSTPRLPAIAGRRRSSRSAWSGRDGVWHGGTSRVYDEDARIRAGWFSLDFADEIHGAGGRDEFDYGAFFKHKMTTNDEIHVNIFVNKDQLTSGDYRGMARRGKAGVFITSGSLRIKKLVVSD